MSKLYFTKHFDNLEKPDDEGRQVLSTIQAALLEKTGHSGQGTFFRKSLRAK